MSPLRSSNKFHACGLQYVTTTMAFLYVVQQNTGGNRLPLPGQFKEPTLGVFQCKIQQMTVSCLHFF